MAIGRAWTIGQTILIACGATSPAMDESVYLRVGVDPGIEATALERQFAGFRRVLRIDGESYSAFSMEEAGGDRSLVRIVTSRGVVLAVDAPEQHGRSRVGLVESPNVDDDELYVFAFDPAMDRECIAIVQVEEDRAREVSLDLESLGGDACVEHIRDVLGDGRAEAIAVVRFPDLSFGSPPRIEVPFGGEGWRRVRATAFYQAQREVRQEPTSLEAAFQFAVELAALAHLDPASSLDALTAFERAFDGWESPDAESRRAQARAVIEAWTDTTTTSNSADSANSANSGSNTISDSNSNTD